MNLRTFSSAVIGIILLLVSHFSIANASLARGSSVDIPLQDLNDHSPIQMQGFSSSQSVHLVIPKNWSPKEEAWIEVSVTASELLDFQRSSLAIQLNGKNLKTLSFTTARVPTQRISIPPGMLSRGNNTLLFLGTLYLPKDQAANCKYWTDPARWLTVDPSSSIHLSFDLSDWPADFSSFPEAFIGPLDHYLPADKRAQIIFVLPNQIAQDDLSALAAIGYSLGANANGMDEWKPEIITESQFRPEMASRRNVVFINNVPAQIQQNSPSQENSISLVESPWEQGSLVLIIRDAQRNDGFTPPIALSDPSKESTLVGNSAVVNPYQPTAGADFQGLATFESMGYLDRTVHGSGQHDIYYRINIPYTIQPSTAEMKLQISHTSASDLNAQESSITVYLNGKSVVRILPTAHDARPVTIPLELSTRRFRRGINSLRVSFDLIPSKGICDTNPGQLWGTIWNTSTVRFTYQNGVPIASLRDIPTPFRDQPGAAIILPDTVSQREMNQLARFSFALGNGALTNDRPPTVRLVGQFDLRNENRANLILVGLLDQNPLIRNLNQQLPQPFTARGDAFEEGFGVSPASNNPKASLGVMQILSSPWSRDGVIMVLSGNNQQGLDSAWEVINDRGSWDRFTGNLMFAGSAGDLQKQETLQSGGFQAIFQQSADLSRVPVIGLFLQGNGQSTLALSLLAGACAILLVIVLLLVFQKIERKTL